MGRGWEEQGGQWFFLWGLHILSAKKEDDTFPSLLAPVTTPEILHSVLASYDYKKITKKKEERKKRAVKVIWMLDVHWFMWKD